MAKCVRRNAPRLASRKGSRSSRAIGTLTSAKDRDMAVDTGGFRSLDFVIAGGGTAGGVPTALDGLCIGEEVLKEHGF